MKMSAMAKALVLLLAVGAAVVQAAASPVTSIQMKVVNNAGKPVNFFWKDLTEPGNLISQTKKPLRNNSVSIINSYEGHTFVAKFRDDATEEQVEWVKGPEEETVTLSYDEGSNKLVVTQSTKETELLEKIDGFVRDCEQRSQDLSTCITEELSREIARMQSVKNTLTEYRNTMSSRLRNYTCADSQLETSKPIKSIIYRSQGRAYPMNIFMDHDDAKIFTLEDFVSDEECAHLMDYARPLLGRATVAGEDGLDSLSDSRRAWQAGYEFDVHTAEEHDPVWPLYQRVIHVMNDRGKYNIRPEGQEGFTIIKYGPGDEYTSHCDGACDGSMYRPGGRVGTAVLYCQAAEQGGLTTFTNADVVIAPRKGTAVFFAYKAEDGRMDEGYTEHSGCPILAGEKWIATAWLREGVSAEQPWTKFDPIGIQVLEGEEGNGEEHQQAEEEEQSAGGAQHSEL